MSTPAAFLSRRFGRLLPAGLALAVGLGIVVGPDTDADAAPKGKGNGKGKSKAGTSKYGDVVAPKAAPNAGSGSTSGSGSASSGSNTTPSFESMTCRGPFRISAGATTSVFARKSANAAGERGDALQPTECALRTRPLAADEYGEIQFKFANEPDPATAAGPITAALSACAFNEDCLVSIAVTRNPSGSWQALNRAQVGISLRGVSYR